MGTAGTPKPRHFNGVVSYQLNKVRVFINRIVFHCQWGNSLGCLWFIINLKTFKLKESLYYSYVELGDH